MENNKSISIDLTHIKNGLKLIIDERKQNTLFDSIDFIENGEAQIQINEGCFYDYEIFDPEDKNEYYFLKTDFVQPNVRKPYIGTIAPNTYVGTLGFDLFNANNSESFNKIKLEVRSVKSEYRSDYRYMLESITEKCTDLIMQIDSPITQHFETNFDNDSQTLYQRFSFVKSLLDSKEFEEATQKILSNPTTKWEEEQEEKDIRGIRRFNQKSIKQLVTKSKRIKISNDHFLNKSYGITSVPIKIDSTRKIESTDTSENRFIKHALEEFLFFCENCETKFEKYSTAKMESNLLSTKISNIVNQSFFKEISRPTSLKLNSPVLQRKSGYREVLNAWLKFDLAAKLVWKGGDNVYDAGKKDIATLYEYWLFFTLLDLLKDVFNIEPKSITELIQYDKGQLSLNLKQGTAIALKGVYTSLSRNLNIQFSYNRSFGGGKKYPNSGSYTTTLRPDYTLSIWPQEIKEAEEAEKTELITHIHFDAKYKVKNFYALIQTAKGEELTAEEEEELLKEEEEEIKKGSFKNQDLLKMHAYKDAIRRTGGAYVLYPGEGKDEPFRGFHELIPGLGAFVIKPNKDDKDKEHLKTFIKLVVSNFIDRASQRENIAVKVHDIHKNHKSDSDTLKEPIPEYINGEKLIPSEIFVLVGYATTYERFKWYEENNKYIFRMDEKPGSLELNNEVVNAKYLLLRRSGETIASDLYEIKSKGPKVFSSVHLDKLKYPPSKKPQDYYLAIEMQKVTAPEFENVSWDFKELQEYKKIQEIIKNPYSKVGMPFTVSMTELMRVKE
ncbi:DUF2357 domain-containing protein [Flavobacterium sp.]|jgi:predicted component of viral defense system (DUF524 family)|uniref:DUF2357 domain-containing protein n=1 Tax=Flavobacterium sp. TaxID=239 RepID=UPI0037C176D9